jgi:hypothetical protein
MSPLYGHRRDNSGDGIHRDWRVRIQSKLGQDKGTLGCSDVARMRTLFHLRKARRYWQQVMSIGVAVVVKAATECEHFVLVLGVTVSELIWAGGCWDGRRPLAKYRLQQPLGRRCWPPPRGGLKLVSSSFRWRFGECRGYTSGYRSPEASRPMVRACERWLQGRSPSPRP